MGLHAVKILGISITTSSRKEILEYVQKYLNYELRITNYEWKKRVKPLVIVTPNPEQVVFAQRDSRFRQILNRADVALPDGVGIVWASEILSHKRMTNDELRITNAIPGVEFMEDLVALAAKRHVPIALIGGRGGLAVEAFECLKARFPGLTGWAEDGPEVEITNEQLRIYESTNAKGEQSGKDKTDQYFLDLAEKIKKTGVQMVFVGLGAPKQEYFIKCLNDELRMTNDGNTHLSQPIVLMSVGGALDELSGRLLRPPRFVQKFGLKWLWRLILEPWRWRRQLALVRFVVLVLREKLESW